MKEKNNIALLLQSFALVFAGVIFNTNTSSFVVIISNVAEHFMPLGMQSTQVSLLQTLPALFIVPAILSGGMLITKFSQKTLIIFGWALYGLCGLALFFINNYMVFIIVRACMGIGLGITLPQPKAMIAKLYDGKLRANMLGYISMFGGLVSFAISLSLGYIAAIDWRYALFVYPFFAVIAITLVTLFVPKLPPEPKKEKSGNKEPMGKFVWVICVAGFFVFVVGSVIQIKTGALVREHGFGATKETGWVSACITLGTFTGGLMFGRIYNKLGRWMFGACGIVAAIGYTIFATSRHIVVAMIGGYISALGCIGTLMPYMIARVSFCAPKVRRSIAITMVSTCTYFGQFMGTFYIKAIESIFGTSASTTLASVAVVYAVIAVIGFIFVASTKKENSELLASMQM